MGESSIEFTHVLIAAKTVSMEILCGVENANIYTWLVEKPAFMCLYNCADAHEKTTPL